ncbi:MAG: hypothetical protein DHS20C21_06120 [Gemmatimonadota bacterium]|nr:MAG: hypothetical protein DHS20C21_06120 [Gemmatimonadota bacterium]
MILYLLIGALTFLLLASVVLLFRFGTRTRDEIAAAESRLSRRVYLLQGRLAELDGTVTRLEFDRRNARGEIRFERSMRLVDAFAIHPRVREVFAAFGLAGEGCSGPSPPESKTIQEACSDASLDVRTVLGALDRFLADPDGPIDARAASARLHRIESLPPSRN